MIARIGEMLRRQWPGAFAGAIPFGDDLAPLTPHDTGPLAWTTDAIMDGVDFDSTVHDWSAIGRKALAVNLSDCAAMAAQPVAALVNLVITRTLTSENVIGIMRGAIQTAAEFDCPIVGGDFNSWSAPTVISIAVAAEPWPEMPLVRRDGMRPGDILCVTGPLGGSILGRHLAFQPRVLEARRLMESLRPAAMIDISDGLALDLARMAEASDCAAALEPAMFDAVIHEDARRLSATTGCPARDHALNDGEDFELIVAVRPDAFAAAPRELVATLLQIGTAEAGSGVGWRKPGGGVERIKPRGWEHTLGE
ncbi:MAG: thiamine-monophosphate kinase [Phycisphaerales bacterium]|nr:thiamine-monophosphate kinase [Phycisphaerales bacterium]